ncbi:RNA transcription, translation and transport factor protein [Condylostylus longicornis]|uniref:RNA transcription, translation and transport factor protein n=1 Tax=Condylostylus longicornis TaxID=2530218 RepID=UPI00244E4702|nr:RNA transcription, translation and transport factor protein [Condylostylus longicornis]
MFKSNLTALEHVTPSKFDCNDRKEFAAMVLWLEDMKIRNLRIENREALRKIDNLQQWEKEYTKYKANLGMPVFNKPAEEMAWLLSHAVRLEYLDCPARYKDITSVNVENKRKSSNTNVPNMKSKNVFDNMDYSHPDFEQGVRTLASQLGFVNYLSHEVLLEAAAIFINKNKDILAGKRTQVTGSPLSFEEKYIVSKDRRLDLAVRIMRFNQIYKLRDLQTKINEAIVAVQNVTADPKTDTKLGKVGF